MSIRNIISLVESVAPTVQSIEETIAHKVDDAAVSDAPRERAPLVETAEPTARTDLGDAYFRELSEMANVDLEEALAGWQSRFRQAYDREQKNEAGFERACDAARLTPAERALAREDAMALAESEEIEEARHGVVPASMLSGMKRWDADHVLNVKDEVESRGGDLSSPEDTKAASADLAFADRALPPIAPRKNAIRAIKENGMFVIEDEAEEAVEEGLVGDVMTRVIANGMSDADIIKTLERAQVARQAAKMSHVRPQHSKVEGWGDADFYTKEEHTLVMKVFKNFMKLHASYGRKNQAVAQDFEKFAKLAGYHGPRPKLAPDGINAHLREGTLDAEWSNTDERRFQNADYTVAPDGDQWQVFCKGMRGPDRYPSQEAAHDACRNHWKWGDWPLA